MSYYVGIDPGLKTGMCVVQRDGETLTKIWSAELDEEQVAPALRRFLTWQQENSIPDADFNVVVERFFITAQTAKNSQAPWSLELIGVVKQCLRDARYPLEMVYWHKPSDRMLVTNDVLRATGLWHRGGAGHANDAARHVLVALMKRGWTSRALLTD